MHHLEQRRELQSSWQQQVAFDEQARAAKELDEARTLMVQRLEAAQRIVAFVQARETA